MDPDLALQAGALGTVARPGGQRQHADDHHGNPLRDEPATLREPRCAITGPGWTLAAVLGIAAAITPGASLSWDRMNAVLGMLVVILIACYGLENAVVAQTTGRRSG